MRKLKTIEMNRLSVEQFHRADKLPLIVVLDNVRSLYNVGSVLRTADAFRVEQVVLCGITATPENSPAEIHKTALGAEDSVDWTYCSSALEAVKKLKEMGCYVWSVEQVEGSTKLQALRQDMPKAASAAPRQAVVLGNEVAGVDQKVVDASNGCLEIPQFGTKHSLNVSVTAGIVMWEFAKMELEKIAEK